MPSTNQTTKQQRRRARARQNSGKLAPQRNSTISAPSAQNRSSFQKRGKNSNSTRYKECERIGTVIGSVAFANILNIPANPALPGSFPWLAGHASLYEKYKVHSLTYRYKNLKGTSTDGNIIMSFDYDTLDDPPPDAITQSQSTVWIDGAPWRIFEMKVPTDGIARFTRTGDVAGSDLKTYDFGRLHVSAEGCSDVSSHGYLEVEYDIECFDKQKSTIVASFNSNPGSLPAVALFDAIDMTTSSAQPILLDKVNDVEVIPYDLYTGDFTPEAGTYRFDLKTYGDLSSYSTFVASWGKNASYPPYIKFFRNDSEIASWPALPTFIQTFTGDGTSFRFYTDPNTNTQYVNIFLCITRLI